MSLSGHVSPEDAAEDAVFLADLLLGEMASSQSVPSHSGRDAEGRPLPKRKSRAGYARKRSETKAVSGVSQMKPAEAVAEEATQEDLADEALDREIQELLGVLGSDEERLTTNTSWSLRQSVSHEDWEKTRPYHLDCLLSARVVPERECSHCSSPAILRCRDCMPKEWLCGDCDHNRHETMVLHNRESCIGGFYQPIAPSVSCLKDDGQYKLGNQVRLLPTERPVQLCACELAHITESAGRATVLVTMNGRYDLFMPTLACNSCLATWTPDRSNLIKSGYWPATVNSDTLFATDVFTTFEEMKITAPGLSRQGFLQQLNYHTLRFGRVGRVHVDVFQRSFLEYTYCQFLLGKMADVDHFTCPACMPNMLAVCADGNRKLYRFGYCQGSGEPYFKGTFIAKDEDVSHFVDRVRSTVKSTQGKGKCGKSQWSAARETARSAKKLDEEGLEVAVCRHGVLLRALNMYRGEIYAYPLYIQKEVQSAADVKFYCTDIACKLWPYLEKVSVQMPELASLLQMHPFLSVLHAKAHRTQCEIVWSGKNQEGAGTTAGEEVEMVNSYLSRCALTTKYMTKAARNDMLTIHAIGWNVRKHEGLHQALAKRYVKTVKKAEAELQRLKDLKHALGCSEDMVEQWVADVQQWATDDSIDDQHLPDPTDLQVPTQQRKQQRNIEKLYISYSQRKASLWSLTDSRIIRNSRAKKMCKEKKDLYEAIEQYNNLVQEEPIDIEMVERRISLAGTSSEECLIWPWEVPSNETTAGIQSKKKVFDAYMSSRRMQEEKVLIVREMKQHCSSIRRSSENLRTLMSSGRDYGRLTEEGQSGLRSLLQEKVRKTEEKLDLIFTTYSHAVGPRALFADELLDQMPEELDVYAELDDYDAEYSEDSDVEDV